MKQTAEQQIVQIKQIIQKDANARGTLLTGSGKMCALGGLAHYGAKVSKRQLAKMGTSEAFRLIMDRFPILRWTNDEEIYRVNDRYLNLEPRRKALCRFFDRLLKRKR